MVEIDQDLFYTFLLNAEDAASSGGTPLATPVLSLLVPNTAEGDTGPVTINLSGSFAEFVRVTFDGVAVPFEYVDSGHLRIIVDSSSVTTAHNAPVVAWHGSMKCPPLQFAWTAPAGDE
jgi:hypothetical protein